MDIPSSSLQAVPFRHPAKALEGLDLASIAHLLAATGDVALVIDGDGIIVDLAAGAVEHGEAGFEALIDRRWIDTVTIESRPKIEEMLAAAASRSAPRWRQINHELPDGEVPVRYLTLPTGKDGRVVAIGRDMRTAAALQQRMLQAQQAMERDFVRLRQAESRYRLLFDLAGEAVLIVDAATRRITEANPAAARLLDVEAPDLIGQSFAAIAAPHDREQAIGMLGAIGAADQAIPHRLRLAGSNRECVVSGTLFRQDRGAYILVRLGLSEDDAAAPPPALTEMLDRMPDPFVLTDEKLAILSENAAFMDLVQCARRSELTGAPLGRFLGRPGIDLNLLASQLREHGMVRNFATIARGAFGSEDDVEISAVSAMNGDARCYGFSIRQIGRRIPDVPVAGRDLPRSVDQLTELVGRVSLKDIVRESTDLVERLCIEAALAYTSDNRASAAELLGLSRQSLYSKLHRHGLGNLVGEAD